MEAKHQIWCAWASNLHRWGLHELVATLLESAGPLTTLGAQAIHLGMPLLDSVFSPGNLQVLADMLEDNTQTQAFTTYLREDIPL